jgi:alkanesulfonate monooxygenase SsuD/methylene tetrahydromethanopterin reductase-like flavin-dependent oxidoreductase (luciferase family)
MRYGLDITPAGPWGRPDQIAELAALAEQCGWDGVFCEDYLCFPAGDDAPAGEAPPDTYDVWITLALIAQATSRITMGTMVTPLPARRPASVALQALTVDHLSQGRLALGVGLGDDERSNFAALGQSDTMRQRAAKLDEALEVITRLWSGEPTSYAGEHHVLDDARMRPEPVARPRIPIWVGGQLTLPRPRARALRWDGACLYRIAPKDGWEDVTADDVHRLRADADKRPGGGDGFTILVGGRERGTEAKDLERDRAYVTTLAEAGADWWQEYVPPRLSYDEARARVEAGPLQADVG